MYCDTDNNILYVRVCWCVEDIFHHNETSSLLCLSKKKRFQLSPKIMKPSNFKLKCFLTKLVIKHRSDTGSRGVKIKMHMPDKWICKYTCLQRGFVGNLFCYFGLIFNLHTNLEVVFGSVLVTADLKLTLYFTSAKQESTKHTRMSDIPRLHLRCKLFFTHGHCAVSGIRPQVRRQRSRERAHQLLQYAHQPSAVSAQSYTIAHSRT